MESSFSSSIQRPIRDLEWKSNNSRQLCEGRTRRSDCTKLELARHSIGCRVLWFHSSNIHIWGQSLLYKPSTPGAVIVYMDYYCLRLMQDVGAHFLRAVFSRWATIIVCQLGWDHLSLGCKRKTTVETVPMPSGYGPSKWFWTGSLTLFYRLLPRRGMDGRDDICNRWCWWQHIRDENR